MGVSARPMTALSRSNESREHFGWIGAFFGLDMVASSDLTRELLGWAATHPGLLADLETGSYAAAPTP
jgi:hypothetical protein